MKVHNILSKQITAADDVRVFSGLLLIVIIVIMLVSFSFQQIYTSDRNQGRDIRTQADLFSIELFKTRTHVALMALNSDNKTVSDQKELSTLHLEQSLLNADHLYLQQHSIIKKAYSLFQQQEPTYTIILVSLLVLEEPQNIPSETEMRLFITYTSTYEDMLVKFMSMYTQLFVSNNALASATSTIELIIEISLILFLYFSTIRPATKKFIKASKDGMQVQTDLIETRIQINNSFREKSADVVKLAKDVVCIDCCTYIVAQKGETHTVLYNKNKDLFMCDCKLYAVFKACFHKNRAEWLHKRIYKEI